MNACSYTFFSLCRIPFYINDCDRNEISSPVCNLHITAYLKVFFFAFGTCLVTIPGKKKAPSERSDFGSTFAVAVTHYLIVQVVWVCHATQSLRLHITCEYWMLRAILWVLLRINFWLKPRVNCMGESGSVAFGKCYRYTVLGCTKAVNLSSRYACRRSPNKTEWKQAFSTTHVHNLLQLGHWK